MSYLLPVATTLLSAIGAFIGVWFSVRSSRTVIERQSRGQAAMKIAEFRQAWINQLRDAMAEFCGIVITPGTDRHIPQERFHNLRCKIDMLMNPKDPAYPALDELLSTSLNLKGDDISKLMTICQGILKREWETLKDEVRSPNLKTK